mmetsp:Transcript_19006/g.52998  ORF Transcript_19006/g.52998 Transcript_19006/m.52998 type:complete len:205 (-) Transcript_19006:115-729(-)
MRHLSCLLVFATAQLDPECCICTCTAVTKRASLSWKSSSMSLKSCLSSFMLTEFRRRGEERRPAGGGGDCARTAAGNSRKDSYCSSSARLTTKCREDGKEVLCWLMQVPSRYSALASFRPLPGPVYWSFEAEGELLGCTRQGGGAASRKKQLRAGSPSALPFLPGWLQESSALPPRFWRTEKNCSQRPSHKSAPHGWGFFVRSH